MYKRDYTLWPDGIYSRNINLVKYMKMYVIHILTD